VTSTASDASPAPRRESPLARTVTDGLEPKNWIIAVAVLLGWHADRLAGVGWGLFAALFCAVVPVLFIKWGQGRGYWGDRHVRRRQDRLLLIPGIMASVVIGMVLMGVLGAPREMIALVSAMLASLVAILAITTVWKISVHTAVSSGATVILTMAYGPWMLLLYAPVAVVGWSRVSLRDHTLLQVLAGTALGALVAGATFALLR
jgi:membrane-associated phospholipid phosphatase